MRTRLSSLRFTFPSAAARRLRPVGWIGALVLAVLCSELAAQQPNNAPPRNFQNQNALVAPAGPQQNGLFGPQAMNNTQQRGAGANADFDSLIDLIQSTVATETWAENGGGEAEMRPFPGGVLVDAAGTLRLKSATSTDRMKSLLARRGTAPPPTSEAVGDARKASSLRYVSLPRLEREIARRQAAHKPLDATMLTMAGLQRVKYIFVYPETGDLVLAGPAGDWLIDPDGRILSADTREPVVRLDDLLVLLRRGAEAADSHFGCSINPRQPALAKAQTFLASSSRKPIEPGQRKKWLGDLRDAVGKQDIEIFGIDPASRVAGVLVEADYHMKLIGMGLADGVDGVESYLASIHLRPGESPPAMSVLRWWFTLNYESIVDAASGDSFELIGQGVRVLSETELLAEQGQRVHTGKSDPLNRQFAEAFTAHFAELAKKYPVYGELRNVFDLSMAVALIHDKELAEKAGWQPGLMASGEHLRLPHGAVPREVETVINHRVINRRTILAGVSGGVIVAPGDLLRDEGGKISGAKFIPERVPTPPQLTAQAWWWDATK